MGYLFKSLVVLLFIVIILLLRDIQYIHGYNHGLKLAQRVISDSTKTDYFAYSDSVINSNLVLLQK